MVVQKKFLKTSEVSISNFDFIDFATATGIKNFYAGQASGAFILASNPFYSHPISAQTTHATSTFALGNDINFDVKFLRSVIINGTILCQFPIQIADNVGSGQVYHIRTTANFSTLSKGVSTFLFSGAVGWQHVANAASQNSGAVVSVALDASKAILIRSGDSLRLNVTQHNKSESAGTGSFHLAFDPKNRHLPVPNVFDPDVDTNLIIQIPFKIDL